MRGESDEYPQQYHSGLPAQIPNHRIYAVRQARATQTQTRTQTHSRKPNGRLVGGLILTVVICLVILLLSRLMRHSLPYANG